MSLENFSIFQMVIIVVITGLTAGCFTWFHAPFLASGGQEYESKPVKIICVFLLYAVVFSMDTIFVKSGVPVSISGWMKNVIILIVMVALSKWYLRLPLLFEILLSFLAFACQSLSLLILQGAQYVVSERIIQNQDNTHTILHRAAMLSSFSGAAQVILCAVMLWLLRRYFDRRVWNLRISELLYLILFPFTGILIVNIITRVSIVNRTVNNERQFFVLYEMYPVFRWLVPLLAVLIFLGILVSLHSFVITRKLHEERENFLVERQQVHSLMERTREVEQFYDGIRQMKHEMRNHLANIQGLVKSENYEEIGSYLSQMDEGLNQFDMVVQTKNPVTDVIVNDKKRIAEEKGIIFETEFVYPDSESYNAYDIGVIVNNLLLNAMEACEKVDDESSEVPEKYIVLSGKKKKKFYLIEVRNSFVGEINMDTSTELPVTSKKEHEEFHGIGLLNVKREAEKYLGSVRISYDNNEFCVAVMLQEGKF